MKIVFLDIDGVLNHQLFYQEKSQKDRYNEVGRDLCNLDPTRVQMLNKLKDVAKFVISSTWRKLHTLEEIKSLLELCGFEGEIIDKTPTLSFEQTNGLYHGSVPRGCEIKRWVEDNKIHSKDYIILDDDSDMLYNQRNNFLLVDGYCGLTPNIVYRAYYILTGTYP